MMGNLIVGDTVEFKGKDSYFKGIIVSVFTKLDGESVRCVVQDRRGLLLIKNPKDAIKINEDTSCKNQSAAKCLDMT